MVFGPARKRTKPSNIRTDNENINFLDFRKRNQLETILKALLVLVSRLISIPLIALIEPPRLIHPLGGVGYRCPAKPYSTP